MKRLLSIMLALSLAGGTAAYAGNYGHGGYHGYDGGYGRYHGNGNGAAVVAGIGVLALIAIMASQNRHDERQPVMDNPPPPQPYDAYPQDYQGSRDYQGGQYGNPPDGPYYGNNGDQQ